MDILEQLTFTSASWALLAAISISVLGKALYNVTLHPLAKFPGPKSRAAFALPGLWGTCRGDYVQDVWAAHQTYGPVVRIAPDALSFATANAWKDIYGLQDGRVQLAKDYKRFPDRPEAIHLFGSNDADHARIRKLVSHGFTSIALRQQEGLVDRHIASLVGMLKERTNTKVDINKWFNIFTFDVMSHLTFGESFGALPTAELDPFTVDFFGKMKIFPMIFVAREYTAVNLFMKAMMKIPSVARSQAEYFEATKARVDKRMSRDSGTYDFMRYIMFQNHNKVMSRQEIEGTTTVLLNAGGQETATCLASTLYYLLKHKDAFESARAEAETNDPANMPYIGAAINEALRVHPPVAGNAQRRTGRKGHVIDGHFVPPNTSVGVNQYAAFHARSNFAEPERFVPERWLADPPNAFREDNKAAFQPFSLGPRNCLGKSLALMVATRTLAQLLRTFDLELGDESITWDQGQKYDIGWDRPSLFVTLKPRA